MNLLKKNTDENSILIEESMNQNVFNPDYADLVIPEDHVNPVNPLLNENNDNNTSIHIIEQCRKYEKEVKLLRTNVCRQNKFIKNRINKPKITQ